MSILHFIDFVLSKDEKILVCKITVGLVCKIHF